jgi:ABC-type Fe3+/spermidine/putrescine transport system ATPase subunit
MRVELRNLQRQLGLMFIHVTHNQEEALSMADRIVVMNEARIQQVADPLTIATKPATELVARFMGDNNIISGKVTQSENGRCRDRGRARRPGQHSTRPGAGCRPSASGRWSRSVPQAVEVGEIGDARPPELRPLRDRLRRVPRRSRASSTSRSAASECWRRCPVERYPAFRGKEGETILISWKEEDVQLLDA